MQPINLGNEICIILGGHECYKTSILLNYAYNFLRVLQKENHEEDYVLFITKQNKIQNCNLFFGKYGRITIPLLQKIQMKYIENYANLVKFLTSFHLLQRKPKMVIIDQLDFYTHSEKVMQNSILMQLITNLYTHLGKNSLSFIKNNTQYQYFKILISNTIQYTQQFVEDKKILDVHIKEINLYKNFFQTIFFISKSEENQYPHIYKIQISSENSENGINNDILNQQQIQQPQQNINNPPQQNINNPNQSKQILLRDYQDTIFNQEILQNMVNQLQKQQQEIISQQQSNQYPQQKIEEKQEDLQQ